MSIKPEYENVLINAACLKAAPDVLEFSLLFSGLGEAFEAMASGFLNALSVPSEKVNIKEHFTPEASGLVEDVLSQIQSNGLEGFLQHEALIKQMIADGNFSRAVTIAEEITEMQPGLECLSGSITPQVLLAYTSVFASKTEYSDKLVQFLSEFKPLFNEVRAREEAVQAEKEQQHESFLAAIKSDDVDSFSALIEYFDANDRLTRYKTPLAIAAEAGSMAVVTQLLALGASAHLTFPEESPLEMAFKSNHLDMIKLLVSSGQESLKDVDWKKLFDKYLTEETVQVLPILQQHSYDIDLEVIARRAIRNANSTVLSYLLNNGLDVNKVEGKPLIEEALDKDDAELIEVLLENGANPNSQGFSERSLLYVATERRSIEVVNILLRYNAKIIHSSYSECIRMLEKLATRVEMSVKELLKQGVMDPSEHDDNGNNKMLDYAVAGGDLAFTKMLVEDFDINFRKEIFFFGWTPLLGNEYPELLEYIVTQGADLDVEIDGEPLIFDAVDSAALVLIKSGAKVDVVNTSGTPYIHHAVKREFDCFSSILETASDLNVTDKYGFTFLQNYIQKVDFLSKNWHQLVSSNVDFGVLTRSGLPLSHAIAAMYPAECVSALVESGKVDFFSLDKNGNSAFLQACYAENLGVIKTLIESGADVNQKNSLGMTPLMWAVFCQDTKMTRLFLDAGANIKDSVAGLDSRAMADRLGHGDVGAYIGQKAAREKSNQ